MKLVENSKLLIPLYHGTSDIFLPSIQEQGLGAQNPHLQLKTLEFLKDLWECSEKYIRQDESLVVWAMGFEKIVNQEITKGNFNFRHGSAYLSPSRTCAVRYALLNQYGSELLSNALELHEWLKNVDPIASKQLEFKYPSIISLSSLNPIPILIEIHDLDIHDIKKEDGEEPESTINLMETIGYESESEIRDSFWQRCNFELVSPIPLHHLYISKIKWLNMDSISPKYELIQV